MQKSLARTTHHETTPWTSRLLGTIIAVFSIVLFWIVVPVALYLAFGLASALAYLAILVLIGIGGILWAIFCL
jgi:hypothetical protein